MALVKTEEVSAGFTGLGGLNALRQIGLMIGLAASVAIGVTVVLWSWAPNYGVLYGALEERDVGMVLDALRANGVDAKLDENTGAVLVPAGKIHDARIKLAAMGLPKGISAGFDALDEKSGFGVSQFMEKARYHRALEIELARTVTHLSSVKNARIHLAIPRQSVFVRNRRKASASVMADLFPGRQLEPAQVAAIVHMVASSVPNLETSQVTVVDQKGKLLTSGASDRQMAMSSAQFEYTRHLEDSLTQRIERILEPMLGASAIRAQVTADVDFTVTEQTRESFNPDTPALRSAQITEEQMSSGSEGGIPGALSNQPPGVATAPETVGEKGAEGVMADAPTRRHSRKIQNYELDKTISHTRYAAGRLHRLSVAVVVDDRVILDDKGKATRMPRTPEQLERLTGLVKEAVGFNIQRGDSVNVMNATFTLPPAPEALPELPIWEQAWIQDLLKKLLGAGLVLLLFFGVLKPVMKSLAKPPTAMLPTAAEGAAERQALADDTVSLTGETPVPALGGPNGYGQNMAMATQVVEQDPKLVAQVVKNWVAADG
jgi:flagellar M-ring protein FliF